MCSRESNVKKWCILRPGVVRCTVSANVERESTLLVQNVFRLTIKFLFRSRILLPKLALNSI